MKFSKLLTVTSVAACLTLTTVFAAPAASSTSTEKATAQQNVTVTKEKKHEFNKKQLKDRKLKQDPLKMLESKKERINQQVKEGKITKAEADALIAKMDAKIKEIKEFNRLPLDQKKEKLTNDFKSFLSKRVKDGKMTQEKANELFEKFNEKLKDWDGNGYPKFKGCKNGNHCKPLKEKEN